MEFISKLPDFIKWYILSFHANPQPKLLTDDIKNYKVSRERIRDIYYNRWNEFNYTYPEINDWLDNDLILYLTIKPTMYGYEGKIHEVMKRQFNWNAEKCFNFVRSKDSTFVSNIIWGLLEIEERQKFIEYHESMDQN